MLFPLIVIVLLFGTAVGELPELLSLTDNASNDFTMIRAGFTECTPVVSAASHQPIPLNHNQSDGAVIRWISTFDGVKPALPDLLALHSVLRR